MVKDYIATEVGDKIIAKLATPYLNVNNVLGWNIKAGYSTEFTAGKISFVQGDTTVKGIGTNLDLNQGDVICAGGYDFIVDSTVDYNLIEYVDDRPSHDFRYSLNNKKIIKELGWKPLIKFEKGIQDTIKWYIDNQNWLKKIIYKNSKIINRQGLKI